MPYKHRDMGQYHDRVLDRLICKSYRTKTMWCNSQIASGVQVPATQQWELLLLTTYLSYLALVVNWLSHNTVDVK